jgi:tetratricopeptide (TPR) repeat protein
MSSVTYDDLSTHFSLLRTAPEKFLAMADEFIKNNPDHGGGYFSRHFAWANLGDTEKALADLDTYYSLEPHVVVPFEKGRLLHSRGRYAEAIQSFDLVQAMDPTWAEGPGPLYRADCYARLGNEDAALADCSTLREDHFYPYGLSGTPRGNKQQVTEEIRRRAAEARRSSSAS